MWVLSFFDGKTDCQKAWATGSIFFVKRTVPSWKLTYPLPVGTFESMIFLFPTLGYVSSLKGNLSTVPTEAVFWNVGESTKI